MYLFFSSIFYWLIPPVDTNESKVNEMQSLCETPHLSTLQFCSEFYLFAFACDGRGGSCLLVITGVFLV